MKSNRNIIAKAAVDTSALGNGGRMNAEPGKSVHNIHERLFFIPEESEFYQNDQNNQRP